MPAGSVAWFATARGAPPPTTTAGAPGVRAAVEALIGTHFARTCGRTLLDATPADDLALPVLAHAHGARSARARSGGVGAVAACLVGDAAWQLDPILAQGAGVALEDAAQLAASVADWRPADGRAALDAALGAYGRAREPRVAALSAVSALPDALGQMTGIRAALRDAVLRATPTPLSAAVFEFFLRLSLAPAPLAGSWSYEPPSPPPSRL
jgi:2-polyprenyl-6-methoxyphenol hydroxylase-like FAD-dependent oxidoreductase